jgi:hypothetical protein
MPSFPSFRVPGSLSVWRPAGVLAALLLAAGAAPVAKAGGGILEWIFPKHDVEVIAVTDTTPAGALRRPVTPANPTYYTAVSAGYRDFGGIIAGDKLPPKEQIFKTIAKVLAKQGYLPATAQHQASLILIWTWGTMYTDRMPTSNGDEGPLLNRQQLLRFMGAYKLGMISKEPDPFHQDMMLPGMMFRDADSDMLYDLSSEDLFVAAISAYDYNAATRNEKQLLWTTKISCPSRGLSMHDTLPAMLVLAGPHIGKETVKPVSIKATETFKAEVKIGDPTVVEYMEQNTVPVMEVATPDAKKQKNAPKKGKK